MDFEKPKRKEEIQLKDIVGEAILYSATDEQIHILNSTAQVVWELCDGAHTQADIVAALTSRFEIPDGHNVTADVHKTLTVLAEKGLLEQPG
jgi:hypothetical protein